MNNDRLVWWIGTVLVLLILFGNQGFRNLWLQYEERSRIEKSLTELRQENQRLNREYTLIQHDPTYNEYIVRKNLKYARKDEIEYRFPPPPRDKSSHPYN